MADKILDLDKLIPDDKIVVIGGKEYKVKADISVKEALELTKHAANLGTDKSVSVLLDIIDGFFIDKIERSELEKIGVKSQLPKLVAFFFGKDDITAAEKKTE